MIFFNGNKLKDLDNQDLKLWKEDKMGFMTTVGKEGSLNYEVSDSGILTIQIDTSKNIGPSASGKTMMLASSGGNIKIDIGTKDEPREVLLGLNLYHY
tara:strand:- start:763 stop:1056 length:294 start_codon:yes stop_codon:yes gene_type:complete